MLGTQVENGNGHCQLEQLEGRQLMSATPTMTLMDAGNGAYLSQPFVLNGQAGRTDAGVYLWTRSTTEPGTYKGGPAAGQLFDSFCIEPDQGFANGFDNVHYNVVDLTDAPKSGPMSNAQAKQLSEFWGRYRSQIGTDNVKGAAFAMGVWEITHDTGLNLNSGKFQAAPTNAQDQAVEDQAQAWLNKLNGCGPKAHLAALVSCDDQDQIIEIPDSCKTVDFCHHKVGCDLLKDLGCNSSNIEDWMCHHLPRACDSGSSHDRDRDCDRDNDRDCDRDNNGRNCVFNFCAAIKSAFSFHC